MAYRELASNELKRQSVAPAAADKEPAASTKKPAAADKAPAASTKESAASNDLDQPRALEALEFGLDMDSEGYNIYALGEPRTGMHKRVMDQLQDLASQRPVGQDLCYVANYDKPSEPRALTLPAGVGHKLREDISKLLSDLAAMISTTFNSDEFRQQVQELDAGLQDRQAQDTMELQEEAKALNLIMLPTPNGFAFAPARDGEVMDNDASEKLTEDERKQIAAAVDQMTGKLRSRLQAYPRRQQQLIKAQREVAENAAKQALASLTSQFRTQYSSYPEVIAHIDAISSHLVTNIDRLLALGTGEHNLLGGVSGEPLAEYQINLLIDRSADTGAPVIYESNPSLENLVGKLEHQIENGVPVTDFSLIRPGALHRANGGFLLIDIDRLLNKPFTWEALKRALGDHCARIESVNQLLSMSYSITLDPAPVPLQVKIVLLGSRRLYHLLRRYDTDFDNLFKVLADFTDEMPWNEQNEQAYRATITSFVAANDLLPLAADGEAAVIEQGSRLLSDRKHLSTHTDELHDLISEANRYAREASASSITREHVDEAINKRTYRLNRIKELVLQNIERGLTVVATEGRKVGQINGLSVLQLGKLVFGQPSRITATARLGRGEFIDIERESKLGGNIHSKAVMIVANFIGYRYAREQPLSLHASLVFEQSYGGIEGDSASIAEVCALLSAIIDEPLRQDIAVTGSMDQHGSVQAIGGVNEKIEGFFDVCEAEGLSGSQGVLIPASNLDNLMLKDRVIQAVANKQFHIYCMAEVDDALALMFGEAGKPAVAAKLEERIKQRLRDLYALWQQAQAPASPAKTAADIMAGAAL